MKIAPPLRFAPSDRLILLSRLDSLRKWKSLDDLRFCRGCHKFISGRRIEVIKERTPGKQLRLVCPTEGCFSSAEDWAYPNEIAQPPDRWGRRAIRVIDKNGERFIPCGKRHAYSRQEPSNDSHVLQRQPPDVGSEALGAWVGGRQNRMWSLLRPVGTSAQRVCYVVATRGYRLTTSPQGRN